MTMNAHDYKKSATRDEERKHFSDLNHVKDENLEKKKRKGDEIGTDCAGDGCRLDAILAED